MKKTLHSAFDISKASQSQTHDVYNGFIFDSDYIDGIGEVGYKIVVSLVDTIGILEYRGGTIGNKIDIYTIDGMNVRYKQFDEEKMQSYKHKNLTYKIDNGIIYFYEDSE